MSVRLPPSPAGGSVEYYSHPSDLAACLWSMPLPTSQRDKIFKTYLRHCAHHRYLCNLRTHLYRPDVVRPEADLKSMIFLYGSILNISTWQNYCYSFCSVLQLKIHTLYFKVSKLSAVQKHTNYKVVVKVIFQPIRRADQSHFLP